MSANVLRRAASLMRERAEDANVLAGKHAWSVHPTGYTVIDGSGLDVGTVATSQEAEHIASWHPAVALAVADLLDAEVARIEESVRRCNEWLPAGLTEEDIEPTAPVLALARAYLGT